MKAYLHSIFTHTVSIPGAFVAVTAGTLLGLKFILIPLLLWLIP